MLRGLLEVSGITKIDDKTVEFKLTQGVSNFKEALCAYVCAIVPVGYERFSGDPTTQIGTGPYMLKEFEVGKQSIHVKNPYYWDTGKPYFDEVHIIDFADADAADQRPAGRPDRRRRRRAVGTVDTLREPPTTRCSTRPAVAG